MHIIAHVIFSLSFSTLFYLLTGSIEGALACLAGGILVDIDHVIECIILHGKIDIKMIAEVNEHSLYKDYIVISLHSLELIIVLLLLSQSMWSLGLAVGLLTHMLIDFIYYRATRQKSLLSLFFAYRLSKGFSAERLCH